MLLYSLQKQTKNPHMIDIIIEVKTKSAAFALFTTIFVIAQSIIVCLVRLAVPEGTSLTVPFNIIQFLKYCYFIQKPNISSSLYLCFTCLPKILYVTQTEFKITIEISTTKH